MTMHYSASEERWLEEKRRKEAIGDVTLHECSDGVFRSGAERAAFEASRSIQPPIDQ